MSQGLKIAPATFIRMVSQVLRPLRDFAPSYFHDIVVHSRAEGSLIDVQVHLRHSKQVFQVMRYNSLYANLKKCVFWAPKIPVLGCYVSKSGVRADPEKVRRSVLGLRPRILRNYESGSAWQIICISIQRIMLAPNHLFHPF